MFKNIFCAVLCVSPLGMYAIDALSIAQRLAIEPITHTISMQEYLALQGHTAHFTSNVQLVTLSSGLQAILKQDSLRQCLAEVAAYKASVFLGINRVPSTVLCCENGYYGVLQEYIQPAYDLLKDDNYKKAIADLSAEDYAAIKLFYFVFGQWDADASNMIVGKHDSRLYLIDNAAMGFDQKAQYGHHPFIRLFEVKNHDDKTSSEYFPFDQVRTLKPDIKIVTQALKDVLTDEQISRLCQLKNDIRYVVWQGYLWRQFCFGEPCATTFYPPACIAALRRLTYQDLVSMFSHNGKTPFSKQFFNGILERRDQVLKAAASTQSITDR